MRSKKPICASPRLSEASPTLPLKEFQCLIDDGPLSAFQGRSSSASFSFHFFSFLFFFFYLLFFSTPLSSKRSMVWRDVLSFVPAGELLLRLLFFFFVFCFSSSSSPLRFCCFPLMLTSLNSFPNYLCLSLSDSAAPPSFV